MQKLLFPASVVRLKQTNQTHKYPTTMELRKVGCMKEISYRNLQKKLRKILRYGEKNSMKRKKKIFSYNTKLPSGCFSILKE